MKERIKFEKFFFFRYVEIVIFGLDIDKKLFFYAWWKEILLFKNPCFFFFLEKSRLNVQKEGIRIF